MITIEGALKEISMLGGSKAIQATDIQVKVIKSKSNFLQNKYALISMNLSAKENLKLFEIIQYHACFQEGCRYFKTFTKSTSFLQQYLIKV